MFPVLATATQLPFRDQSFDAVIVSDVLEHVPPECRAAVIREALRVTRKVAIFGFPCGQEAFACDRRLATIYEREKQEAPTWLKEHMRHPFPTESLFDDLPGTWAVKTFGNENLGFHLSMMRKEMNRIWNFLFLIVLAVMPRMVEYLLRQADREPFYRKVFVLRQLGMGVAD